ncbi:MAG TPA: peptidylprolyl isomerase [Chloroflexota bacterium]|nr:peptidylprolyl isomerase [Chloroflexota bacterium]
MKSLRFVHTVPMVGVLLLLAGCGLQQVQPKSGSSTPGATPTATPAPLPTVVVTGGNEAAIVNGQGIPMSLFRDFMNYGVRQAQGTTPTSTIYQQNMQQLIQNELVLQYAKSHGMTASEKAINGQINQAIRGGGGPAAFRASLKQRGLTLADFKYVARVNLLLPKVENAVTPLAKSGPVATAEHILISPGANKCSKVALTTATAKKLAQKLLRKVEHGVSFAKLAKKCSADPGSAPKGGVLSNSTNPSSRLLYPGSFVLPFDTAVFTGPVGTPQLVHSQYGYHVVLVLSRHTAPYSSSVAKTAQQFYFSLWLQAQQKKASIQKLAKIK